MHAQAPSDRAHYLASLIEAEGVSYGREDSFKLSHAGLLTERFLLGIPMREISTNRVMHLCHLSGGLDKNGEDFMSAYYETQALDD